MYLKHFYKTICLGLPHIHGVAWIDPDWLKNFGIYGNLIDYPEKTIELADKLVSCSIATPDKELNSIVKDVQKHNHSKSCQKYGTSCRFGFPKLPARYTLIAQPLPDSLDPEEKKAKEEQAKKVLTAAKELLESPDINEDMSIDLLTKALGVTDQEYHELISIMEKGTQLVHKRNVNERFINCYNPEIQKALQGNTDFQLAFDIYSVVTYMVSYVSKDDTGMTKFLTEALKATADAPLQEKLKALKLAYLKHKQLSASDAVYRVLPSLHMKHSNIACVFVQTGFPENRTVFFKKVHDNDLGEDDENEDEVEASLVKDSIVEIANKPGKYKQSSPIHDRYAVRPSCVEKLCLAQFSINYTFASRIPKSVTFSQDGSSEEDKSERKIFNSKNCLPKYLKLLEGEKCFMRLRSPPAILRIHKSDKKVGHEKHYSELLLYVPWREEENDLERHDPGKCIQMYNENVKLIEGIKKEIFLGEETVDMLDSDMEALRPSSIYEKINPQGEQDLEDDKEEGLTDDPRYAMLDHDGKTENVEDGPKVEKFRYRVSNIETFFFIER